MTFYHLRTPEEIALTNFYIDKWDKILCSTQPVDRSKAEQAVVNAYHHLNLPTPEICFLTSASQSEGLRLQSIMSEDVGGFLSLKGDLERRLLKEIQEIPSTSPYKFINCLFTDYRQFDYSTRGKLFEHLWSGLYATNTLDANEKYNANFYKILSCEIQSTNAWALDLYVNNQNDRVNLEDWNILKALTTECPYLITWDRICIIIEKPCELYLDTLMLPHADAKAAIKYADGYEVYCYHGIVIPEKYGKIPIDNWQPQWIFDEQQNPTSRYWHHHEELGIALRFGIGYKRFYERLPDNIDIYWKTNVNGHWKNNGHPSFSATIEYAYYQVIFEWMLLYYYEHYNGNGDVKWYTHPTSSHAEYPLFIAFLWQHSNSLIPGLKIDSGANLFTGEREEIYYVLDRDRSETFSTVYCKLPGREPMVYAECLTSWIVAIAQCYQEGAYYISIDPESGQKKIEQNLDMVEQIFEKFNPKQIDAWREIWRS